MAAEFQRLSKLDFWKWSKDSGKLVINASRTENSNNLDTEASQYKNSKGQRVNDLWTQGFTDVSNDCP